MTDYSDDTNALILRIQIATPKSRAAKRLLYARGAWDEMTAGDRASAVAGRSAAIAAAMELNRGLIVTEFRKWRGIASARHSVSDIERAAESGFIAALQGFDLTSGFRFTTYCVWAMQNEILKEFYSLRDFAAPQSIARDQMRVRVAIDAYQREHKKKPSRADLARIVEMDQEYVRILTTIPDVVDGAFGDSDDGDQKIEEHPAPETTESQARKNRAVEHAKRILGESWDEVVGTPLFDRVVMEGANEYAD